MTARSLVLVLALAGCVTVQVNTGRQSGRGSSQDVGHLSSNSTEGSAEVPVSLVPK